MTDAVSQPLWKKTVDFPLVAMIIALLVIAVVVFTVGEVMAVLTPQVGETAGQLLGAVIVITLSFLAYKLVIRHLGERKHDDLRAENAVRDLGLGIGGSFLLMAAIVGIAAVFDVYNIVGEGGFSDFVFLFAGAGLIAGFMEELIFRGILFRWIEEFAGSWAALVLTALFFGFAHDANPNATTFSSIAISIEAGLLLGAAYMWTRSLWLPIGIHFGWNMTQGFVFDVPVSGNDVEGLVTAELSGPELLSGGAFGLEASLIALVLATAAGLWMLKQAMDKGEVMAPWWVRRKQALSAPTAPAEE
ncbi:CPBP family intramembrane glutamic endopeptidase [Sphingomicrobium clamense]|uniref:CPBP family intramembrane metalloprotease n=1 Tax=Sphingomicrobium clamense TaxID=2851013 RepID=A0ABS6V7J8_9SPHN|nr:type II CAAX endopeptidase family protein [Sphingomicrobium sp. B8]MBW0145451.1 CPBP family intramembrane metalloprotease [Sphingomicrobium sp. B8]